MYVVTKRIDFCYGHRLLNYEGKCKYLHGHNGRVEIELEGERLDDRGMVTDFGDIKRVMSGVPASDAVAAFASLWVSDEHWAAADRVMNRSRSS